MASKFDEIYQHSLQKLNVREKSHSLLLDEAIQYDDQDGMVDAMQGIANIRAERKNLVAEYNEELARQRPAQRYISEEQRAARAPGELDCQDLGKICGISPEEYWRQYQRLGEYKRTRGDERK